MKLERSSWLPVFFCLLVSLYTVGVTPTLYVMIFAAAALALAIWGAIAAKSGILLGWSSACMLAACTLNLMEKRPVAWFEPALMGLGVICFLDSAHITTVFADKDVSPEMMECHETTQAFLPTEDIADPKPQSPPDHRHALRALLSAGALRAASITGAALAFSYVYFALASTKAVRIEEAYFMMVLGTTVIGVSMYWLIRLAAPDAYKKPHR